MYLVVNKQYTYIVKRWVVHIFELSADRFCFPTTFFSDFSLKKVVGRLGNVQWHIRFRPRPHKVAMAHKVL